MRVEIDEAALEAEEVVEPVLDRAEGGLPSQVPFPDQRRCISRVLHELRERAAGHGEAALVICGPLHAQRVFETHALLVTTGDQAGARRCARGRVGVEIREADTVAREPIEIRRSDVGGTIDAEVAVPRVIRHDVNDVRSRLRLGDGATENGNDQHQNTGEL